MNLTKKYLPNYNFTEKHSIIIKASQIKCYEGVFDLDLSKIWIVDFLFKLSGLPVTQKFSDFTRKVNFTLLEEKPFSEFIFGFGVNKEGIQEITNKEGFITDDVSWFRKVIWSFEFIPVTEVRTKVVTITSVKNIKYRDKIMFSVYWFFIKPFSGLIRKKMLKRLKQETESQLEGRVQKDFFLFFFNVK